MCEVGVCEGGGCARWDMCEVGVCEGEGCVRRECMHSGTMCVRWECV